MFLEDPNNSLIHKDYHIADQNDSRNIYINHFNKQQNEIKVQKNRKKIKNYLINRMKDYLNRNK